MLPIPTPCMAKGLRYSYTWSTEINSHQFVEICGQNWNNVEKNVGPMNWTTANAARWKIAKCNFIEFLILKKKIPEHDDWRKTPILYRRIRLPSCKPKQIRKQRRYRPRITNKCPTVILKLKKRKKNGKKRKYDTRRPFVRNLFWFRSFYMIVTTTWQPCTTI